MSDNDATKPFRVHKADKTLQTRVGTGPLDERLVERSQKVMDSNTVDFAPLANEFLDKLDQAIQQTRSGDLSKAEAMQSMTTQVMQLKANAATFKYILVGNLANIMLSFLESVKNLDEDALTIVSAHQQTLKAIVAKKMAGDGGAVGQQMEEELKAACKRYFAKRTA